MVARFLYIEALNCERSRCSHNISLSGFGGGWQFMICIYLIVVETLCLFGLNIV